MIEIIKTAPLNTVQDPGRAGYRCHGIARSGPMDGLALAIGNALLGNHEDAAGIEFQMFPASLRFHADTLVAVTGAGCNARLNGRPVPAWWVLQVRAGDQLEFVPPSRGARCYLTVYGGIDVPVVLGSRATSTKSGFGGFEGRALRNGDRLPLTTAAAPLLRDAYGYGTQDPRKVLSVAEAEHDAADLRLRMMPGAEYAQFNTDSQAEIFESVWKVTVQSNRQGYRLQGETSLALETSVEMRSHAIVAGVVQVPPSGQPIIQLAEGNSAGGYPKIGHVIGADLWRIAQAPPGTRIRFVACDLAQAQAAHEELLAHLAEVRHFSEWLQFKPRKAA